MVKKITTHKSTCNRCKGTGKVDICDRCGREIYRYEHGFPICHTCTDPDAIMAAMNLKETQTSLLGIKSQ